MAGQLGKFQSVGPVTWKGLTKSNHLGALYGYAPQKVSNWMVQILAMRRGRTLDTLLTKYPVKEFDNTQEYHWEVVGSSRRNIPLVEARDENGTVVTNNNKMIGAGTAPFYLVFGEDWFADGRHAA